MAFISAKPPICGPQSMGVCGLPVTPGVGIPGVTFCIVCRPKRRFEAALENDCSGLGSTIPLPGTGARRSRQRALGAPQRPAKLGLRTTLRLTRLLAPCAGSPAQHPLFIPKWPRHWAPTFPTVPKYPFGSGALYRGPALYIQGLAGTANLSTPALVAAPQSRDA